jgi:hypothetical protein
MTDWLRLIWDLREHGMNTVQIAKETDVCIRTVGNWANGTEPPHCKGQILIEVHRLVAGSTE